MGSSAVSAWVGVILGLVVQCTAQNPEVDITLGKLVGVTADVPVDGTTHTVNKFLGIPFGKPPVGDLRFSKPEAVGSLGNNPYNASYHRSFCPHMHGYTPEVGTESEDCLYLNVYVPRKSPDQPTGHAVMVWIYGGGFAMGAADFYNGSPLAAVGNVIVVTVNYRLAVLGFLSTYDDHAPGNCGLHDQLLALHWVQDNIKAFGGDNDRVTIFGESAGAMSVSIHGLNPDNHGLFQRIIAESGTATTEYLDLGTNRLSNAQFVAKELDCPTDDNKNMIECLRTIPLSEFKKKISELDTLPETGYKTEFKPTVDGDLVKYDYMDLSRDSEEVRFFQSIDFMNGINAYEGGMFISMNSGAADPNAYLPSREEFHTKLIPTLQDIGPPRTIGETAKKVILHEYTNWTAPFSPEVIRLQYCIMMGDAFFGVPATETSYLHVTDASKTFMYQYMPVTSTRANWSPLTWLPGADHAEELDAVFGAYLLLDTAPEWEKQLSINVMTYWSNFATSGSPNSPNVPVVDWPSYDLTNQHYMELNHDMGDHSRKQYLGTRETEFWREVLPGVMEAENNRPHTGDDVHCDVTAGAGHQLHTGLSLIFSLVLCAVML